MKPWQVCLFLGKNKNDVKTSEHWSMWRHIDVQADWRRSSTYGLAPNAIDISYVGFFNEPVQAQAQATLLYGFSEKPPHLVAFYDTLGIRRTHSRLNPPGPHGDVDFATGQQVNLQKSIFDFSVYLNLQGCIKEISTQTGTSFEWKYQKFRITLQYRLYAQFWYWTLINTCRSNQLELKMVQSCKQNIVEIGKQKTKKKTLAWNTTVLEFTK